MTEILELRTVSEHFVCEVCRCSDEGCDDLVCHGLDTD